MSIAGVYAQSSGAAALREMLRGEVAETGDRAHVTSTARGDSLLVGDRFPVPLAESATAFAPRPGVENIKQAAAEILRQAQAIPREDRDVSGLARPDGGQPAPEQSEDSGSGESAVQPLDLSV